MIDLLYTTGMRRSELMNLTWSDIDRSNHNVRIFGKGNKMRIVPLFPHIEKTLDEYKEMVNDLCLELTLKEGIHTDRGEPLYPKLVDNKVVSELKMTYNLNGKITSRRYEFGRKLKKSEENGTKKIKSQHLTLNSKKKIKVSKIIKRDKIMRG
jgi:integrase